MNSVKFCAALGQDQEFCDKMKAKLLSKNILGNRLSAHNLALQTPFLKFFINQMFVSQGLLAPPAHEQT